MNAILSQTDVNRFDKFWRLIHKMENRLEWFRDKVSQYSKSDLYPLYEQNLNIFEGKATKHINELRGVVNYFITNETVGKGKLSEIRKGTLKAIMEQGRLLSKQRRNALRIAQTRDMIYIQAYEWVKLWPKRLEHLEAEIGIKIDLQESMKQPDMDWVLNMMAEGAKQNCVRVLQSRLFLQFIEAIRDRWFIAFATLTVDPEHYDQVFEKGSTAWRDFIRRFKRHIGTQAYGSVRNADNKPDEWFHYCSVTEEGDEEGRLHIHTMFFIKDLTRQTNDVWKGSAFINDPNYGKQFPNKREIEEWLYLWPYGTNTNFIATRWNNSDPWAELGWCWPVKDNGQPIDGSHVGKMTNYMTEYMTKSNTKETERTKQWRTRTNRLLGKTTLTQVIQMMPIRELLSLIKCSVAPTPIIINKMFIPHKLIRTMAVKELINRLRKMKKEVNPKKRNTDLKTLLRTGIRTKLDHKQQSITDSIRRILGGGDISKKTIEYYGRAKQRIQDAFPPDENRDYLCWGKPTGK